MGFTGALAQQGTGEGGGCGGERKMWKQDGFEEQFNQDRVPHQHRERLGQVGRDISPNLATLRTDIHVMVAKGPDLPPTASEV
ncbi:unnamed protein product [Gadus morhua 'NCC']